MLAEKPALLGKTRATEKGRRDIFCVFSGYRPSKLVNAPGKNASMTTLGDLSRFYHVLRAYVGRRVAMADDADEIVQTVMMRLHLNQDRLHDANVTAWLLRVARNAVIDHYRSRAGRPPTTELSDDLAQPVADDDDGERQRMAQCLHPLLQALPPHYAQAVEMADFQGLPHARMAEELGIGLSAVKSRVQRGRALLRAELTRCCSIEIDHLRRAVAMTAKEKDGCSRC